MTTPSYTGNLELDSHLLNLYPYPEYVINHVNGYFDGDILTGMIVHKDDFTLNSAKMYYFNTNYTIKDSLVIKPYPC